MLLLNISQKISENTNSLREILQFSRLFLNPPYPIVKKKTQLLPKMHSNHFISPTKSLENAKQS